MPCAAPIRIGNYVGGPAAAGETYTADAAWSPGASACNGWVLRKGSPTSLRCHAHGRRRVRPEQWVEHPRRHGGRHGAVPRHDCHRGRHEPDPERVHEQHQRGPGCRDPAPEHAELDPHDRRALLRRLRHLRPDQLLLEPRAAGVRPHGERRPHRRGRQPRPVHRSEPTGHLGQRRELQRRQAAVRRTAGAPQRGHSHPRHPGAQRSRPRASATMSASTSRRSSTSPRSWTRRSRPPRSPRAAPRR